jgi:hypothetical protein
MSCTFNEIQVLKSNLCHDTGHRRVVYYAFNKRFICSTHELKANELYKIAYLLSPLAELCYCHAPFIFLIYQMLPTCTLGECFSRFKFETIFY